MSDPIKSAPLGINSSLGVLHDDERRDAPPHRTLVPALDPILELFLMNLIGVATGEYFLKVEKLDGFNLQKVLIMH